VQATVGANKVRSATNMSGRKRKRKIRQKRCMV